MSKYFFGILVMLAGVYFLLENLGYSIGLGSIINTYWPAIIIVFGLKILFDGLPSFFAGIKRGYWVTGSLLVGLLITSIGTVMLGNNLEWFSISLQQFWNLIWPILIIYLGLKILFNSRKRKRKEIYFEFDTDQYLKHDRRKQFIGELNYGDGAAWNLDDIRLWHGIGETQINLATAIVPEKEVFIDLTGIIGEIIVLVPQHLPVKVNVDVRVGDVTVFNHNQSGTGRFISYASEDYETAKRKVNIMVSLSIGEVTVKQVD